MTRSKHPTFWQIVASAKKEGALYIDSEFIFNEVDSASLNNPFDEDMAWKRPVEM